MADAFNESISFTGQKRRIRPVRRVQVSTHFGDLEAKPLDLATPPPTTAPEPMIILKEDGVAVDSKTPQAKEAGYADKSDDGPIDVFAFLTGITPKTTHADGSRPIITPATTTTTTGRDSMAAKPAENAVRSPDSKKEAEKIATETKENAASAKGEATKMPAEPATQTNPAVVVASKNGTSKVEKSEALNSQAAAIAEKTATATEDLSESKMTTEDKDKPSNVPLFAASENKLQSSSTTAKTYDVQPENPAELPPAVPNRPDRNNNRTSLISVNSHDVGIAFADSDAGAITQRQSIIESDFSETQPPSATSAQPKVEEPQQPEPAAAALPTASKTEPADAALPIASKTEPAPAEAPSEQKTWKDFFKPRALPILPVAEPAKKEPEKFESSPPIVASNVRPSSVVSNNGSFPLTAADKDGGGGGKRTPIKLATYQPESGEFSRLREQFDKQTAQLDKERQTRQQLEHQLEALKSKCEAQDEALRYKNEKVSKMEQEFIDLKNKVIGLKMERDRVQQELDRAESELKEVDGKNAAEYIERSDEVIKLKQQLDKLALAIGEKDHEISVLNARLKEAQDSHVSIIFESLNALRDFDDEFISAVEAEVLKMETMLKEENEYCAKLQKEVESEYSFWKRALLDDKAED